MAWVLQSPQIHNTFSNLGFALADGYHVNDNCNDTLECILQNILNEDKYLRTYRRSISFGQNIKKDLIPLLINTKDDKTIELLIKILVNLTIPVECLLSLETVVRTDIGRHTVFEINSLLSSAKISLTDHRVSKVVVDFLKKNADCEQNPKLSTEQITNISNTLLFLRNLLNIPEDLNCHSLTYSGPPHTLQNQLLWNLFSQSIDKVLIKLMTIPDSINWGVTMVQLIALLYKDQHATTLHKLLNMWLEASLSESSEDNESNTSPPIRGSDDSSPMLTSDPMSDSSDTGASGKSNGQADSLNSGWDNSPSNSESGKQSFQSQNINKASDDSCEGNQNNFRNPEESTEKETITMNNEPKTAESMTKNEKKTVISETSDCGYGTQIENQEVISTSSNEDELPTKKPVHQKPHTAKQRINNKVRTSVTLQERKRKKIVKRGKTNIINVQGLSHHTPTDDDISNVLKEFTVDFLLKGYNCLFRTLHTQILTNVQLEIDTSHFFWLVTYFLKFATQIELDLEHVGCVLSFEIVSYLTAEGVNLCEQFELAIKLDGNDLKPSIRRLHLVVTAIREFVQAIEVYKKSANICNSDKDILSNLQIKMCETEELRLLLVLLLRHYNTKYHTKQYLQDLIVTNHILLTFLDNGMRLPEYKGTGTMIDHIRQFSSPEIMCHYGLLLEDYEGNGEFVNDCVFTVMHHVGGELGCLLSLFQPKILKTFTTIWKSEFELCDDWSDLIEYVINTFIKKPITFQNGVHVPFDVSVFDDDKKLRDILMSTDETKNLKCDDTTPLPENNADSWTTEEISSLSWNYMQSNSLPDVAGEIVKLFKEDGILKTRESVIKQLYNQFVISKDEFERLYKNESEKKSKPVQEIRDTRDDEIGKLCGQLIQDGKSKFLDWVQTVLLETCYAKIYLSKTSSDPHSYTTISKSRQAFDPTLKKPKDLPVMSSVSYHSLLLNQSVPLVPWNCQQASICKDLKFLQLLHKLGFHMPVDSGKVFIRIPHFWTSDFLYEVAGKISAIDVSKLKFSVNDISQSSIETLAQTSNYILPELSKGITLTPTAENYYQIHNKKQNHLAASIVNYTPTPGSAFATSDDNNKLSWLEVVQKSQEYKITLDLGKSIIVDNQDVVMKSIPAANPALIMSTIMSVKEETTSFVLGLAESENCNNSVCETASVASDLTRMYVSDEDEKPERPVRPSRPAHSRLAVDRDPDEPVAGKRPRVDFCPLFK